jgi:hypothetical protein
MLRKIVILAGFILAGLFAFAEDPRLEMSAPNAVSVGDQFRLTFSVNARGENLKLPDLSSFDVLMGPSTSQSTSVQIINGRTTQSQTFSYTYILRAKEQGSFNIRPASIEVDGKIIQSNPLTIQVVTGRPQQQQQQPQQGQPQGQPAEQAPAEPGNIAKEDLFLRLELSKRNVFKGEQIIATVKLYASPNLPLAGFEEVTLPTYEGFFTQDIDIPQQISFNREVYNDKIYQVGILKKTVLFPQQSGAITIRPFSITTLVQQRVRQRSFFDDFFSGVQTVRARLTADAVSISVRDLPPAPANFFGGVGSFNVTSEISDTEVTTNDAVTLKLTISGTGNLRLIQSPKLELSSDFDLYDPRSTDNIRVSESGMTGSRTVEYLFQPRFEGSFTVPPIQFAFFNPASGQYERRATPEYSLQVTKGADDPASSGVMRTVRRQDLQLIGQDIRFIWQKPVALRIAGQTLFGSSLFYGIYSAGILLFLIFFIVYRKKLRENANVALVRNKKANQVARKHLRVASSNLKKNLESEFYESVLKAFWGYLSDKLGIPPALLKRETAIEGLQQRNVDEALIREFLQVADQCEFARFAPAGGNQAMHEVYASAEKVISKMEKQIKR